MTDLFEASGIHPPDAPLADRLRPRTLDEVVGQDHLLGPGGPIRRMVEAGRLGSMILSHHLVQRARPQPVGQRCVRRMDAGGFEQVGHAGPEIGVRAAVFTR